jgi:hypothetical protein
MAGLSSGLAVECGQKAGLPKRHPRGTRDRVILKKLKLIGEGAQNPQGKRLSLATLKMLLDVGKPENALVCESNFHRDLPPSKRIADGGRRKAGGGNR